MDGFLNILKPPGRTSADIVFKVRRQLPRKTRIGHGGTLDPEACGVLPICIGSATRLFDYIIDKQKTYIAEIALGAVSTTQDGAGELTRTGTGTGYTRADFEKVIPELTGDILQQPPAYSAVKKNGRRLYAIAREGGDTSVAQRLAHVERISYIGPTAADRHLLRIECGKGVYIRTILHDMGQKLGCGAYMAMLTRTQAGAFSIAEAIDSASVTPETIEGMLLKLDYPLERFPRVAVTSAHTDAVRNGNVLQADWLSDRMAPDTVVRVYLEDSFAGMARIEEDGAARFQAMLWKE